jgi:hypothetical protein
VSWLSALACCVAVQFGCGPKAEMRIIQASLPPPQDSVRLRSEWAYIADEDPDLHRILLSFPLPGARAGDKRFFLYLRVPSRMSGPVRVGDALPDGGKVGGFFIQSTGRLAGKTTFVDGKVEVRRPPLTSSQRREGKVALDCSDGSFIRGEFRAIISPFEVLDFESSRAGDVRELLGPQEKVPQDEGMDLGPTDSGSPR